jgi:hypothetical protein
MRTGNRAPEWGCALPSREQVRALVEQGLDYTEIGRVLGVPAGQACLIGTGMPADGGETSTQSGRQRAGVVAGAQRLLGLTAENPTTKPRVLEWIRQRASSDAAMQAAARNQG